ncbi:hypothetical protein Spla01_05070 [Streptomyces platensis]|uniref:Transmembrane protein n=1 Tax=Streptomyces platensis TaxID=58346 RepID=A0ABX3XZ14_STRPT|nr:hypothetical protein [Streptomyces platensis]OSY45778.1 hypothetical protein BG653_02803 [Streptomyces platensis]
MTLVEFTHNASLVPKYEVSVEFYRAVFSVVAALVVPMGLSWHKKPWYAVPFSTAYASFGLLPLPLGERGWLTLGAVVMTSVSAALLCRPWERFSINFERIASFTALNTGKRIALAMLLIAGAVYAYIGAGSTFRRVIELSDSNRIFIVISGCLIAVVGCGNIIAKIVKPLVDEIESNVATGILASEITEFVSSAAHIGWIERVLLFGFLASGKPEAAALVIAAKSFTRSTAISQGGRLVADYYLVGTLASVASALLVSCATRLALGLPPI